MQGAAGRRVGLADDRSEVGKPKTRKSGRADNGGERRIKNSVLIYCRINDF